MSVTKGEYNAIQMNLGVAIENTDEKASVEANCVKSCAQLPNWAQNSLTWLTR